MTLEHIISHLSLCWVLILRLAWCSRTYWWRSNAPTSLRTIFISHFQYYNLMFKSANNFFMIGWTVHTFWLFLTYDLLEDRLIDDININKILFFCHINQIDFMLLWVCKITDHRRYQWEHQWHTWLGLMCHYFVLAHINAWFNQESCTKAVSFQAIKRTLSICALLQTWS